MHISDVEKARMEKDHKMRNGYQDHDNSRFPHDNSDVTETRYAYKDLDNKHARDAKPEDMGY